MEKVESVKQISVDPISLTQPNMPKFMSSSLPNSASSSPRFDLAWKHKKKHKIHESHLVLPMVRQHSVALVNLERLRENHLRRSKSCGEGRACQPSLDFDLWSKMETESEVAVERKVRSYQVPEEEEKKFKCGACLFLPGLGKGKTVRARKEVDVETSRYMAHIDDIVSHRVSNIASHRVSNIVSHRASLEKFECGSWRRSSAIMNAGEDSAATSALFFDLPVELIRCSSVNDAESPVTTGFVFDNHNRKGVLKSTSTSRKSQELSSGSNSSRHVRFSTSSPKTPPSPFSTSSPKTPPSPSCITPRLHKARDDFNAFLEAQSV